MASEGRSDAPAGAPPAPPAGGRGRGCLRRAVGCAAVGAGLVLAAVVMMQVVPGWDARRARESIQPGMPVAEVLDRGRGWLSCHAYAGTQENRIAEFAVGPTRFGAPRSDSEFVFSTRAEMASALAAEMGRHGVPWTMTFGYVTTIPKRIYFDVEFSPDGRVTRVSETRWGVLN